MKISYFCKGCGKVIEDLKNTHIMIWNHGRFLKQIGFTCSEKCTDGFTANRILKIGTKFNFISILRDLLKNYDMVADDRRYIQSLIMRICGDKEIDYSYSKSDLVSSKGGQQWCYICKNYVDSEYQHDIDYYNAESHKCCQCGTELIVDKDD